ncbi:adenosylcobinamide amidohydrolase [Sphaerisporangium corydalis]|uniref:Adenosylcobinamide amidohydrolase n=1 Tax=Sphaerisporangium corydalis TaxID=1441875 RepID=A0ABV9E682_9ACTN|nr:adenosylcobinamide amidohydrolase [Sphaerisporangium corydalis]
MLSLTHRHEDGARLASLLWHFGPGWRMISSAMVGGGIGPGEWVLNAQVVGAYSRMDPIEHLRELAPGGPGVGMMTAASVAHYTRAGDAGVEAVATVGLRVPTLAALPEGVPDRELWPAVRDRAAGRSVPPDRVVSGGRVAFPAPGTINIIVSVPVAMCDAALVNTVMTVTEAKSQALAEAGYACTGTASDAVCVAVRAEGPEELFGGPRSTWGARIARAVHGSVLSGARAWERATGTVQG